jgi:hypothetical protein
VARREILSFKERAPWRIDASVVRIVCAHRAVPDEQARYARARRRVHELRAFYLHAVIFVAISRRTRSSEGVASENVCIGI